MAAIIPSPIQVSVRTQDGSELVLPPLSSVAAPAGQGLAIKSDGSVVWGWPGAAAKKVLVGKAADVAGWTAPSSIPGGSFTGDLASIVSGILAGLDAAGIIDTSAVTGWDKGYLNRARGRAGSGFFVTYPSTVKAATPYVWGSKITWVANDPVTDPNNTGVVANSMSYRTGPGVQLYAGCTYKLYQHKPDGSTTTGGGSIGWNATDGDTFVVGTKAGGSDWTVDRIEILSGTTVIDSTNQ